MEQMIEQLVHDRFKKENLKLKHAKKRCRVIESESSLDSSESETESNSRSRSKDKKCKSKANPDQIKSPSDTTLYTPVLKRGLQAKNAIDRISNFVESMRMQSDDTPSSSIGGGDQSQEIRRSRHDEDYDRGRDRDRHRDRRKHKHSRSRSRSQSRR